MAEPWNNSRFPAYRRSKTVFGEIGDVTKRKNSLEVNKLGARLRLMGREMEAVNSEIRHQQAVLEVKASNSLTARRRSASLANTRELLIRNEQDNMQTISQKCKDFLTSGVPSQEVISQSCMEGVVEDEGVVTDMNQADNALITVSTISNISTDPDKSSSSSSSSGFTGDSSSSSDVDPATGKMMRERKVVHNMDVQLDLDPSPDPDSAGFFPGRKDLQKMRRPSNAMMNNKWESLSKPKFPVRSKRELEVRHQEEMKKMAVEEGEGDEVRVRGRRRRSLPVIMGRSITRHDRKESRSRDNLLLPEVGRHRSVSPDVRINIKYADDKDDVIAASTDVPFSQRLSPRQVQAVSGGGGGGGRGGSVSPRQSSPRIEIDLSLPVASMVASPRPNRVNKSDKAAAEG